MVFINLEKIYGRFTKRNHVLGVKKEKKLTITYISMIKDAYNRTMASVRITGGNASNFSIIIYLHQKFVLCP